MKPADLLVLLLLVLGVGWLLWPTPEAIEQPVSVTLEDNPGEYGPLRVDGSGELRTNNATGELFTHIEPVGDQTVSLEKGEWDSMWVRGKP